MSDPRDALLFLELDKGGDALGPLFEESRRLVKTDGRLRAGWFQYQALRALAVETAPDPGEKMVKAVLLRCRREKVGQQLAQAAGGEDLARDLLLGRVSEHKGPPSWVLGLMLLGALGLGYWVFRGDWLAALVSRGGADKTLSGGAGHEEAVPFEFSILTPPAEAALGTPPDEGASPASDADDVHSEPPAARQARRILREHLHAADARDQASAPASASRPLPETLAIPTRSVTAVATIAAPKVVPKPTAPASSATPVAAQARHAAPAVQAVSPTAPPTRVPAATPAAPLVVLPEGGPAAPPDSAALDGLSLSSHTLAADAGALDVAVGMPERKEIDVRLFDAAGRSVRVLAMGAFGPGIQHFPLDANDDKGQALKPGAYYLRVMTPWYSRVESIQIQ